MVYAQPVQSFQSFQPVPTYVPSMGPDQAAVGVDTNLDGRANFMYVGADRNHDGVPDALESRSPYAWPQYAATNYAAPSYPASTSYAPPTYAASSYPPSGPTPAYPAPGYDPTFNPYGGPSPYSPTSSGAAPYAYPYSGGPRGIV